MDHSITVKLRQNIKSFIQKFGYDIVSFPKLEGPYEKINVKSFYAPWKEDIEFLKTFKSIQPHSLVDKHRCYELWDLVSQSAKLKGALLEVGVWRGGTGGLIAKRAELCGITEPVYLCDTFEGVVKASTKDTTYKGGEHADTSPEIVQNFLSDKLSVKNTVLLQGIFPDQTGNKIAKEKFRFCHIDVDVYESTRDIVDWLWPRLSVGGIIAFDDYGIPTCSGIREFVNERKNSRELLSFHNLNGHAIWVKLA